MAGNAFKKWEIKIIKLSFTGCKKWTNLRNEEQTRLYLIAMYYYQKNNK